MKLSLSHVLIVCDLMRCASNRGLFSGDGTYSFSMAFRVPG